MGEPHQNNQVFANEIFVEPDHFSKLPILEPLENGYQFNINLNSESASKASWMFSNKLNKVFVKINSPLNIYIDYIEPVSTVVHQELIVRAMIVYTSPNEIAEPVKKCPNHRESSRENYSEHILRCAVPETNYVGVETGKLFKDKLAVVVPMSAIASNEPLKLHFTCQNSCSGGINRKATAIVFTLEDQFCNVLGRQSLHFKVCSCPKRDKDKDEEGSMKNLPKKRKLEHTAPSTSKKVAIQVPIVKQESDSTMSMVSDPMMVSVSPSSQDSFGPFELKREQNCDVNITMPSVQLKQQMLTHAYNLVAGEMTRTGDVATYQRYLTDLQKQIGK